MFPKLIEILGSGDFDIQKEAAWAVSNASSGGTADQILYLASQGVIPPLCSLLLVPDNRVITVAIEGLENILRAGQTKGPHIVDRLVEIFHECNGVSSIKALQHNGNRIICERSTRILGTFF